MWLIDTFRYKNKIVLWLKTNEKDIFVEEEYSCCIYADSTARSEQTLKHTPHYPILKKTPFGEQKPVFAIPVPTIDGFEQFVKHIEELTRYRVPLYNADIPPEQQFLYEHNIIPCSVVECTPSGIRAVPIDAHLSLTTLEMEVHASRGIITAIRVGKKQLIGNEFDILFQFLQLFTLKDPDVILLPRAPLAITRLAARLKHHGLAIPFHRYGTAPLTYKGGKSFYSYGQVRYQDYSVRLHGRFLVDTTTPIGSMSDVEAIVELCQLSGTRFQQLAGRSYGAVFQASLVRTLIQANCLVPYKEKPAEKALSMLEMLDADRAGHTFDPLVGFHTDVAEIDFASMYPWLIYNHNISAETLLKQDGACEHVPGTHLRISLTKKGYTPQAIKPLLDRRMWYKKNPTAINKRRAAGLKWVLVSCYGYLRFREFKLGLPSAHMAICAFAREKILSAAATAEEHDCSIVHGIIDALYIKKKGITEEEVRAICTEIEITTGIPMIFEGLFKWVVFLPSITDSERPVPTRYYGVFRSGEIKVRGIELRQRGVPRIVKQLQQAALERMSACTSEDEIRSLLPDLLRVLRGFVKRIAHADREDLLCTLRISKTNYKNNIAQKHILTALQRRNITVEPGQSIQFIYARKGVCLPDEFAGDANSVEYTKRLVRALFVLLQPFGISREYIEKSLDADRQERLQTFL